MSGKIKEYVIIFLKHTMGNRTNIGGYSFKELKYKKNSGRQGP